ncbi:MAG: PilZ domain-containing protein [bacterium]|nr:PilZ domain-containing protein [bacterium]
MISETLDTMIRAGTDALQTTCGLTVTHAHVSLVQQGSLTFPALGELRIRNGTLQKVNLGCDTVLVGQLAGRVLGGGPQTGVEDLADRVLANLLEDMEGRRPRGNVENLAVTPITLQTRGQRTFGVRLETDAGRLFLLAEIPSKIELEDAKNSDYVGTMISTYLPREWFKRERLDTGGVIDSFLVFARKVEADLYLEVPGGGDAAGLRGAFLIGNGMLDGHRALKVCADLKDSDLAAPSRGDTVRATMGLADRSFAFELTYLGEGEHELCGGASLPCAWFAVPELVTIGQRRSAFRLPLLTPVTAELECPGAHCFHSPWGDEDPVAPRVVAGRIKDLSFSGARIVMSVAEDDPGLEPGKRVRCLLRLPGEEEPVVASALIRRVTLSLADRNEWQRDVGLEFQVTGSEDRDAVARICEFVLALERFQLSRRVSLSGARPW